MAFGTLTCASYCFDFVQVNPEDKFHLVLDDVPWNLLIPFVSIIHSKIPSFAEVNHHPRVGIPFFFERLEFLCNASINFLVPSYVEVVA
jgi:hypothetical protein